MDFELFTYGGGELLRLTFNAIAAFMTSGNDDYMTLLKISAMVGLLVVLVQSAFKGGMVNFQWLLAIVMIYYVAMVPKANVVITDRVNPAQSGVVSNVPIGLAATAGLLSHTGDWLTQGFEALFSLPGDMEYSTNGLLFGSRLVEAAKHFEITDPRISENLSEFWQQCVFYDVLLGRYGMQDLFNQPDVWAFIQTNTSKVRAFPYKDATNTRSIMICNDAAEDAGPLGTDVANAIAEAERYYGDQLVRASNRNAAIAKFSAALPTSFQFLTGLSMSSSQIVRQAALFNSMKRGVSAWAAKVDAAAAAQDYAMARAESERRTAYAVMGELASRMMPIIRNIFEAFIYAIFPIVFILFMLPIGAKAALGYAKALVWINLWAPIYAVLHLAITLYSADAAKAAVRLPDGTAVYSMANYTGLAQVMNDHALLAGYLTLSIPMIAWMLVNSGGAMMASLAGKVMQSYEAPVSSGANEASAGNIQLGNTGFGNASWWQSNTAPSDKYGTGTLQGPNGVTLTQTTEGSFVSMGQTSLPVKPAIENAVRSGLTQATESSVRAARSELASAGESSVSGYQAMNALATQTTNSQGVSHSYDSAEVSSFQNKLDQLNRLTDSFKADNQLSREQKAEILGLAALSVTQPGLFKLVNPVNAEGQVQLKGSSGAIDRETFAKAMEFAQQTGYGQVYDDALQAAQRTSATYTGQTSDTATDQYQATLSRTAEVRTQTQATLERAEAYREARDRVETSGFNVTTDMQQAFLQYLARDNAQGLSGAVAVLNRANSGQDPAAAALVQEYAERFGQDHALRLAGVAEAPAPSNIEAQGRAQLAGLRSAGAATFSADSARHRQSIEERRDALGTDEDEVRKNTGFQREQVQEEKTRLQNEREARTEKAQESGQNRLVTVNDATNTEQQTLLVDALDGAGKVLPYTDKFSELADRFKR